MNVYENLASLGLTLPEVGACQGVFVRAKPFGANLLYVSGSGSETPARSTYGKLGAAVSLEEGKKAAEDTVLNILTAIESALGDLNRVTSFVKLLVFVSSSPDFCQQPAVANGASELLVRIFGEEIGCPARSAIGVAVLPGDISVETECLIEYQ